MKNKKVNRFKRVSFITLIAVYFLILVGGIVRSTGSGMGCPDWPKCFGSYIPPTSAEQLPGDYKEYYSNYRHQKNLRFATMVEKLGYKDLAYQLRNDPSLLDEEDFNATKTWVEYLNRLLGAVIGLLVVLTFVSSLPLWSTHRNLVVGSFALVVMTGFQGWVGSIVVSTNLMPGMITFHMVLALLIVLMLIYLYYNAIRSEEHQYLVKSKTTKRALIILLVLMSLQVVLGTQVREAIDEAARLLGSDQRNSWIETLGASFYVHRSFSLVLIGLEFFVLYSLFRSNGSKALTKGMKWIIVITGLEIAGGALMAYFGVPPFIQPVHLLFGTLLVGLLYYLLISTRLNKEKVLL